LFELIQKGKEWICDQNAFILLEKGLLKELPRRPEPPSVVVDLLAFSLEGKLRLTNLVTTSLISELPGSNIWNIRKLRIVELVSILTTFPFIWFSILFCCTIVLLSLNP